MSILTTIKNWANNIFKPSPKKDETTNDNTLDNKVNTFQPTKHDIALRFADNTQNIGQKQDNDEEYFKDINLTEGILNPKENITGESRESILNKAKKEEEKSIGEKLSDFRNEITDDTTTKTNNANDEFNERKNRVALGYDGQGVLYLQGDDSVINMGGNEYSKIFNDPNATDYEKWKAVDDWYNATKDLFTIERLPSSYNSLYNEDTLNTLAGNNVSRGAYPPTKDEWIAYITSLEDNETKREEIYKKYGLQDSGKTNRQTIDLTADASNKWFNGYFSYGNPAWLDEKINTKLYDNPEAILKAKTYFQNVLQDQSSRQYPYISQVYTLEQIALAKAPSERNEGDLAIIDGANKMRKLEKIAPQNWANWMSQILDYGVDENGNIVDSIDTFADGQSLGDILTNGMFEAAELEADFRGKHASQIDIVAQVANDAIYKYYQSNLSGWGRKGWNKVERFFYPMGDNLGELGQFAIGWTLHGLNAITGNGWSPTASYLDQDASIGRLIETDDGAIKRTVKKYSLQLGEYAPEGLANLAPDIALSLLSGGGTLIKGAQKIGKFAKWMKGAQALENINKSSKAVNPVLKGLEKIGAFGDELGNINKGWKIGANILDRATTQMMLGQLMDGQWSAYDTEPYSNASFALSMWGSVLFDIMPELKTLRGVVSRPRGSVWNLVDYISSSPEAADNIAQALWKKHPEFSLDDIKQYASIFGDIEGAAEQVWKQLPSEAKVAANKWTKELMYNYVSQAYGANSTIARNIREIMTKGSLNPADILKYFGAIPGEVSLGPYVSSIRLKNGTRAALLSTEKGGWYNEILDTLEGGFDRRLHNGFSEKDIEDIGNMSGYKFANTEKEKVFEKIGDKYYLTDYGLDKFNLEKKSIPLESLGLTLDSAENTRNILKEKMKNLSGKKLSDKTIDALADSGGYDAVVEKVKEILGC